MGKGGRENRQWTKEERGKARGGILPLFPTVSLSLSLSASASRRNLWKGGMTSEGPACLAASRMLFRGLRLRSNLDEA